MLLDIDSLIGHQTLDPNTIKNKDSYKERSLDNDPEKYSWIEDYNPVKTRVVLIKIFLRAVCKSSEVQFSWRKNNKNAYFVQVHHVAKLSFHVKIESYT